MVPDMYRSLPLQMFLVEPPLVEGGAGGNTLPYFA